MFALMLVGLLTTQTPAPAPVIPEHAMFRTISKEAWQVFRAKVDRVVRSLLDKGIYLTHPEQACLESSMLNGWLVMLSSTLKINFDDLQKADNLSNHNCPPPVMSSVAAKAAVLGTGGLTAGQQKVIAALNAVVATGAVVLTAIAAKVLANAWVIPLLAL